MNEELQELWGEHIEALEQLRDEVEKLNASQKTELGLLENILKNQYERNN